MFYCSFNVLMAVNGFLFSFKIFLFKGHVSAIQIQVNLNEKVNEKLVQQICCNFE